MTIQFEEFLRDRMTHRCWHTVHRSDGSFMGTVGQCKRGGIVRLEDGTWRCGQHDPSEIAKRDQDRREREDLSRRDRRVEIHGKTFYAALQKIADGHNDARGLAGKTLKEFGE